jgi:hypothetical protein
MNAGLAHAPESETLAETVKEAGCRRQQHPTPLRSPEDSGAGKLECVAAAVVWGVQGSRPELLDRGVAEPGDSSPRVQGRVWCCAAVGEHW